MSAFNGRLTQTEFYGMPVMGAVALVVALLSAVFALAAWGGFWGWFFLVLAVVLLLIAGVVMAAGEELTFLRFRLATALERNARTIDAVESE